MAERYRRKPTEIEAVQWDGTRRTRMAIDEMGASFFPLPHRSGVATLEAGPGGESGWVHVPVGFWVVTDGKGDFWPINAEQFAATYEKVEGTDG